MTKRKTDLLIFAKAIEKYAVKRIAEEAEKINLDYRVIYYEGMSLEMKLSGIKFYYQGDLIPEARMALFRVAGQGGAGGYFVSQRTALLEHWQGRKINVLNTQSYLVFPRLNKLSQHCLLAKNYLPFVSSWNYGCTDLIEEKKFTFPQIVKNKYGSGGRKVFKADSLLELRNLLKENTQDWLIQPFLPTGYDFRVIVIGGEAIGVMKKTAPAGEFLTNVAHGGLASRADLTDELKDLAERTARVFKADYVGVDIMYDAEGRPYVLEANRGAQFEGFERSTGINVAQKMIEFLLERRSKKEA